VKRIVIEKDDASPWRATFEGDVSRADVNRVLRSLLVWYKKHRLKGALKKKQVELNHAEAKRKAAAEEPKTETPPKSFKSKAPVPQA
jgi:hypothetical protein